MLSLFLVDITISGVIKWPLLSLFCRKGLLSLSSGSKALTRAKCCVCSTCSHSQRNFVTYRCQRRPFGNGQLTPCKSIRGNIRRPEQLLWPFNTFHPSDFTKPSCQKAVQTCGKCCEMVGALLGLDTKTNWSGLGKDCSPLVSLTDGTQTLCPGWKLCVCLTHPSTSTSTSTSIFSLSCSFHYVVLLWASTVA